MLTNARYLLAGAVAAIPVLVLAAAPFTFQEPFDDGTLDGVATISGLWKVANGQVRTTDGYLTTPPLSGADYDTAATVTIQFATIYGAVAGVIARFQDTEHYYYAGLEPQNYVGRTLVIYKVSPFPFEADSLFTDDSYPGAYHHVLGGVPFPIQTGLKYDLRLRAVGNTLSVWMDGTEMFSVVDHDDAYTNPGAAGLIARQQIAFFDNWSIQSGKGNRR
jgi:hypothetical protein